MGLYDLIGLGEGEVWDSMCVIVTFCDRAALCARVIICPRSGCVTVTHHARETVRRCDCGV